MKKLLVFLCCLLCAGAQAGTNFIGPVVVYAPVVSTGSNWTSGTTVNSTQTIYTGTNYSAVLVQTDTTTTVSGGAITFQVSYDGTNYVAPAADQVVDPTSASLAQISLPYTLVASTNKAFLILTHGAQAIQIKLSTAITGSATLTPYFTLLNLLNVQEVTQATSPWVANISQFGGNNVVTGTGAGGSGIPRVTISNDSALAANQSSNLSQINGQTAANGGVTGSLLVEQGCAGQTVANTSTVGFDTNGSSSNLKIVTKASSKKIYICSINVGPVASAVNVGLIEGTKTTNECDTAAAGLNESGTTAARGWNFAANGGITFGNGIGVLYKTANANDDVCLVFSGAVQVNGSITYAQF